MGEEKKLFPIPAYLELGDARIKVLELGINGLLIEWDEALRSYLSPDGTLSFTADFVFPYDGYSEIVLKGVSLRCKGLKGEEPPKTLFCSFANLSSEQQEFFRLLVRDYLWRRIISIPSEFMNYTQDEEVRKELLSIQKTIELKKRLKKIALVATALAVVLFAGLTPMIVNFFYKDRSSLTVRYLEESSGKSTASVVDFVNATEEGLKEPGVTASFEEVTNPQKTPATSALLATSLKLEPTASYQVVRASLEEVRARTPSFSASSDSSARSEETLYCVQVASSPKPDGLIKIAERLASQYPDVRVERIGSAYTLRVGLFKERTQARRLARELKKLAPKAFWRTCAYKPERWVYPKEE